MRVQEAMRLYMEVREAMRLYMEVREAVYRVPDGYIWVQEAILTLYGPYMTLYVPPW